MPRSYPYRICILAGQGASSGTRAYGGRHSPHWHKIFRQPSLEQARHKGESRRDDLESELSSTGWPELTFPKATLRLKIIQANNHCWNVPNAPVFADATEARRK
jgi:hypothetical protein